jgi:uncharacterized heparinase superfamily protein
MINQILRLWHTTANLRPVQIYGRIRFRLARPRPDLSPPSLLRLRQSSWQQPAQRHPSLIDQNVFRFLNESGNLVTLGWDHPSKSKLWRYNQHYFDDLNAVNASQRVGWHRELMSSWIDSNPPGKGTGWEAYPTSLRVVNWIKWACAGNHLTNSCVASLAIQARWLTKRLEYHLLGNHLFANAKALIFAGSFYSGEEAASWLKTGLDILEKEIPEQILTDGGQFERSTMYHALSVEDMLDLLNILRQIILIPDEHSIRLLKPIMRTLSEIEHRLPDMLKWLNTMRHPDGEIAMFNDAAFGVAPTCDELLQYAERLAIKPQMVQPDAATALRESGYVRLSNAVACVLFDAAPIGPDYLPGHAHADTLSLELSLFGRRVFVNSGTSEYGVSEERYRQRSTVAHNTVEINCENSSEVWSGFRVARRAYPYMQRLETKAGHQEACAWHDGYQRLSPPVHIGRRIVLTSGALEIEDQIHGRFKSAVSRFYCHPRVTVSLLSPSTVNLLLADGQTVKLSIHDDAQLSVEAATWHPEFGVVRGNQCIVVRLATEKLITRLKWDQP